MYGCGVRDWDDLVTCEEVEVCAADADCTIVNFDDCCGLQAVAILDSASDVVTARIEECPDEFPICPLCPIRGHEAQCVDGRCILVDL